MTRSVILLGGRGDPCTIARAIDDAARRGATDLRPAGLLNDQLERGAELEGLEVLGPLADAAALAAEGHLFLNAIYRVDGNPRRIALFESLRIPDESLATFVHPTAYVAPGVEFGPGCVVMPSVCISPDAVFGRCCIVLQGATVGHNTRIDDHTHISAQACIGGYVKLGRGVHVGMNSTLREGISVGDNSTVGMASAALKDIPESQIWAGNPARFLRAPRDE